MPPSSALTVPNFGVGWVLEAVAMTTPIEFPFTDQVWPPSVDRFTMKLTGCGTCPQPPTQCCHTTYIVPVVGSLAWRVPGLIPKVEFPTRTSTVKFRGVTP